MCVSLRVGDRQETHYFEHERIPEPLGQLVGMLKHRLEATNRRRWKLDTSPTAPALARDRSCPCRRASSGWRSRRARCCASAVVGRFRSEGRLSGCRGGDSSRPQDHAVDVPRSPLRRRPAMVGALRSGAGRTRMAARPAPRRAPGSARRCSLRDRGRPPSPPWAAGQRRRPRTRLLRPLPVYRSRSCRPT
jgi:hypothetical protein